MTENGAEANEQSVAQLLRTNTEFCILLHKAKICVKDKKLTFEPLMLTEEHLIMCAYLARFLPIDSILEEMRKLC